MRFQHTGLLVNSPSDLASACALFGLPSISLLKFTFRRRNCLLDAQAAIVLHEIFHLDELLHFASQKHVLILNRCRSALSKEYNLHSALGYIRR